MSVATGAAGEVEERRRGGAARDAGLDDARACLEGFMVVWLVLWTMLDELGSQMRDVERAIYARLRGRIKGG